jgi:tetratricopeptide (TPR) repeat protein
VALVALLASLYANVTTNQREDDAARRADVVRFRDLLSSLQASLAASFEQPAEQPATGSDPPDEGPSTVEDLSAGNPHLLNQVALQASEATALLDRVGEEVSAQELAFLGFSLSVVSRPQQAAEVLTTALARDPAVDDRIFVHQLLGTTRAFLGDREAARADFELSLRLATEEELGSALIATEARYETFNRWLTAEAFLFKDCEAVRSVGARFVEDVEIRTDYPAAFAGIAAFVDQQCAVAES